MSAPVDVLRGGNLLVPRAELNAALRAHWPSFDRMRPDYARKWEARMLKALEAAALARCKGGVTYS